MFVDIALARRIEDGQTWRGIRYVEAQARLHPEWDCAVEPIAGGYALYAGTQSPVNRMAGLGMERPVTSEDMDQVQQFFRRRGVAPRIEVCPLADPSLRTELAKRSYRLDRFHNAYFRLLDDTVLSYTLPADVRVTLAGPEQADLWLNVVARGFEGKDDAPPQAALDVLGGNVFSEPAQCFLAWVGSEAVGGGGMYLHEDGVELGGASVLAGFRRHGVHQALLAERLAAARRLDCTLAGVGTTPGSNSERNILRAGFQLAYTKVLLSIV